MRFLSLFVLIGYLGLMLGWMGRTPAYNADLRVQTANGGQILPYTPAMYDEAEYLLEVGYGYVFPDINQLINLELSDASADIPLPNIEEVRLNAQKGVQFLEQSLELAPNDARTWMALAWGYAVADGTSGQMLSALRQSWRLGPHDRGLSARRLSLIALMIEEDPELEASLTDGDRAAISTDKATLSRYEPRTLQQISDGSETALLQP